MTVDHQKSKTLQWVIIAVAGVITVAIIVSLLQNLGSKDAEEQAMPSETASGTGFLGVQTLPKPLQDKITKAVAEKVASCVQSDQSMPAVLGGDTSPGYTCLLPLSMGANIMVTISDNPVAVSRIEGLTSTLEPFDVPGARGFTGQKDANAFVLVLNDGTYQDYACTGVSEDQRPSCLDELKKLARNEKIPPANSDSPEAGVPTPDPQPATTPGQDDAPSPVPGEGVQPFTDSNPAEVPAPA